MSTDQLQRPKGNEYDDDAGWYRGTGSDDPRGDLMNTNFDDLDALPETGPDHVRNNIPGKKSKPSNDGKDGDELKQDEANSPNAAPTAGALGGEKLGAGYSPGGGGARGVIKGMFKKKSSRYAGGGIAGIIAVFVGLGFGTGSLYLQDLTSNLRSKKNPMAGPIQRRLERRRTKSALTSIKKGSAALNQRKFANKLKANGFEVKFTTGGVIDSISKDGSTFKLNRLEAATIQQQGDAIFSTKAGQAFIDGFDNVAAERAATTVGKRTKNSVIKNKLGISAFTDWIENRKRLRPSELANAPPQNQFADAYRNAADTDTKIEITRFKSDSAVLAEEGFNDDNPLPESGQVKSTVDESTLEKSTKYADEAKTNGGKKIAIDVTEDAIIDSADDITEDFAKAGATNATREGTESVMKTLLEKISGKAGAKLAGKLGTAAASGLDISQPMRIACRVKGTLNFIANVRNVLLAQELASFAVRYFTIADHQRAGLVQSESVKLMSIYLSGATSSGGMQRLRGNPSAAVGRQELSKASVTRSDGGLFGAVRNFINQVPGVNDPKICKLSNNFLVSVGATVVGGLLGIVSGGTSAAASIGISVGLTTVEEVTFAVAEPMILKAVSKQVVTGLENPKMAGAFLASGASALAGMSGNANVGLPTTKALAASLRQEAVEDYKRESAQLSLYDRYVNLRDGRSLLSTIAFRAPKNTGELSSGIASIARGGIASIGSLNSLQSLTTPLFASDQTYAASIGSGCTDDWLAENNIETDAYCNILTATIIDTDVENAEQALQANGLIDGSGQPTDKDPGGGNLSFKKWVENCASGRAGLMYDVEVDKTGGSDPRDDTCIKTGGALAGDVLEKFEDPSSVDGRSWFAKKLFPRAMAQTTSTRTPGVYERYATWMGYLVDEQNLAEDINDQLNAPDSAIIQDSQTTSNPADIIDGPDTSNIPCSVGTDYGPTDGYAKGQRTLIRTCGVRGGFVVNSQVSKQVDDMVGAAAAAGMTLTGSGFRDMAGQISAYNRWCERDGIIASSPPFPKEPGMTTNCPGAAAPGYSNHQMGLALDISCDGSTIPKTYAAALSNRCFIWLQANAGNYGFYELGNGADSFRNSSGFEGWHWSVNGG